MDDCSYQFFPSLFSYSFHLVYRKFSFIGNNISIGKRWPVHSNIIYSDAVQFLHHMLASLLFLNDEFPSFAFGGTCSALNK